MKKKCYVDNNLKVVNDPRRAKAIVNFINGRVEILFLSPIAHDKNIDETWQEVRRWAKFRYSKYLSAPPTVQTCRLANLELEKPLVCSCYTSTDSTDFHGRREFWHAIDAYGNNFAGTNEPLENVYLSLFLTQNQFYTINPWIQLANYQLIPY